MNKNILKHFIYLWISIVLFGCTSDSIYETGLLDGSVGKEAEVFGKQMAGNLRFVVTQMNKNGDDFGDLTKIKTAIVKYMSQYAHSQSTSVEELDKMLQRRSQLTPVQMIFLEKIGEAQAGSPTASEFMLNLKKIINEIRETVPEIQQRNLLKMTVALYCLTKEIDALLKEGLMPVDLKQPQHIRLRSGSEADSYWSALWAGICVSAIDIGAELLVILEEFAAAAGGCLLVVGGCLLLTGDTEINRLTPQDCTDMYVDCIYVEKRPSRICDECRVYCVGQHKWDCPRPH